MHRGFLFPSNWIHPETQVFHLKNNPELNPSNKYGVFAEEDEELKVKTVPCKSSIFREFLPWETITAEQFSEFLCNTYEQFLTSFEHEALSTKF